MIRAATAEDANVMVQVHVESWRSTYRGLMPEAVLGSLSVDQRADFWRGVIERVKKQFVFVATDEQGTIVGFGRARA